MQFILTNSTVKEMGSKAVVSVNNLVAVLLKLKR